MKAGDQVIITYSDTSTPAAVFVASTNHKSLLLAFPGVIAGHAGAMGLSQIDGERYRSITVGIAVLVTGEPPPPVPASQFRCVACAAVFERGDERAAVARFKILHPTMSITDAVRVCDDCGAAILKGMRKAGIDVPELRPDA